MAKAKTRLGNATFVTRGYGQVEPNHLSAPQNGQVYAQLPADKDITILENGQFVKYDYAAGVCNFTGEGQWLMVYNEIKVYDVREGDADFAMIKDNYGAAVYSAEPALMPEGTKMVPRVLKVPTGDIWTTNTIMADAGSLSVGDKLHIGADGYLTAGEGAGGDADPTFKVVKVYTMPDLQPGVKIQRIA